MLISTSTNIIKYRNLIIDPTGEERMAAKGSFSILRFNDNDVLINKEPGGYVPYKILMEAIKDNSESMV